MLLDTVDSLDVVSENARKFYSEVDGKFILDPALSGEIKGLKTALDTEKNAAKDRAKALKDYETKYAGIDPDKVRQQQKMFETNEEARLISEGKLEEVVQQRTEKWRAAELDKQNALQAKIDAAEARANSFKDKVLDDAIRIAAVNAGLTKQGIRDSLLLAKTIFTLDENGNAVQKNSDGSIVIGRDGKSPYSPTEFYETHKVESPGWYSVNSTGSPASGSASNGGGRQMKRNAFDALNASDKLSAIKNGVKIVD